MEISDEWHLECSLPLQYLVAVERSHFVSNSLLPVVEQ
jgi:hypothetical protein